MILKLRLISTILILIFSIGFVDILNVNGTVGII